jgi:hypothetical protein
MGRRQTEKLHGMASRKKLRASGCICLTAGETLSGWSTTRSNKAASKWRSSSRLHTSPGWQAAGRTAFFWAFTLPENDDVTSPGARARTGLSAPVREPIRERNARLRGVV